MSRTVAKLLGGVVEAATLPLGRRQKEKTIGRLNETIARKSIREIPTKHGSLKLYALRGAYTASAVERFGRDEPETVEWIDAYVQPGETLWDIGANIGLYSLYAGRKGANVMAFEPSALNFSLLAEHIQLNGLDKMISPLCIALGLRTAIDCLHMGDFSTGHASNALGVAQTQFKEFMPVFSQAIPAFTADEFCRIFKLNPPDHIKLDVDGIEDQILAGMKKTLPCVKTLAIEVEGRNAQEVAENIERPLFDSGFRENTAHRAKGSKRNRLYIR